MTDLVERLIPDELRTLFRRVVPPTEVTCAAPGSRAARGGSPVVAVHGVHGLVHHDTSDVAFAVLDPTRTRVAVLAATDTDADRDGPG
ncbi:hypothetical protein ACFZBC_05435 [Streptomyces luteogriseus]|uniref:hypothetical protein n=1 Tax=Streptomyces luteogriseus TaxID=68233 RepID=UPI0036E99E44